MHIVTIGNRDFAAGLWWQVLDGQARIGRKERFAQARTAAGEFGDAGYDAVVFRERQYGLGTSVGKFPRVPSLACALVDRSPESWIGLFHIAQDLWWVCAVGKRIIAGDGDHVFQTLDEAKAHFANLKSLTRWESEICLEDVEKSLTHIQGLIRLREKVEPLYPRSHKRLFSVLAIACVLFVAGVQQYLKYQEEQERKQALESLRNARKQAEASRDAILQAPGRYFSKEWLDAPLPSVLGKAALEYVFSAPVYESGWHLDSIRVDRTGMSRIWAHAPQASFVELPHNASLNKNPTLATSRQPLPIANATRPALPLSHRTDATASLYQLTQLLGARLSVSWAEPEEKEIEDSLLSAPVLVRSPWQLGTYSMSSIPDIGSSTRDMFFALDRIPGLVIGKILWKNNQFTVEGTVHAMP